MKFRDSIASARATLRYGKMRSVLTMLGIVIGIASVIVLMSIGKSAQDLIINQVQGLGSNLIIVVPGGSGNGRFQSPAQAQGIVVQSLTQQDITNLSRDPSIAAVAAEIHGQATASYGDNSEVVTYSGVTANFFDVMHTYTVQKGYPFTNADVQAYNHVVVLGASLAQTLFGNADPIGRTMYLKGQAFRVVGVLTPKGTGMFGINEDNLAVIPVSVAQKQILGVNYFSDFVIEANPTYTISFAQSRVEKILEQDHGITNPAQDDFTIETQQDVLNILGSITSVLTLFLTAIASISLLVGGIGIMNIMLVSVIERTREIGLRKAVGATNGDILQQFLIESVLVTVMGGIIGIAFGALVVTAVYFGVRAFSSLAWTFAFPPSAVVIAVVVSSVTGIVFGIYPARQAARKSPIDALRYE